MKNQKLLALVMAFVLALTVAAAGVAETLTGEAEGFGGPIKAEVTVENGAITALTLTGEAETPAIGGVALETLTEAIKAAGTIEGVGRDRRDLDQQRRVCRDQERPGH